MNMVDLDRLDDPSFKSWPILCGAEYCQIDSSHVAFNAAPMSEPFECCWRNGGRLSPIPIPHPQVMQNMHRLQSKIALYVRAGDTLSRQADEYERDQSRHGPDVYDRSRRARCWDMRISGFSSIRDDILDLLRDGITLVPNSSKTRQEIDAFCDELGTSLPFICENGAALVNRQLIAPPSTSDSDEAVGLAPECLMIMWDQHIGTSSRRHCHFLADLPEAEQALASRAAGRGAEPGDGARLFGALCLYRVTNRIS
jgi:hypothetical protein